VQRLCGRRFHYKLDYYKQRSSEDGLFTGFELLLQTTGVEELCFVNSWTELCAVDVLWKTAWEFELFFVGDKKMIKNSGS
jgi:hypothetical protein